MIKLKNLFKYALPFGLTLFCWLSMRTVASFSDESMNSYGFPLPWHAPSGVSSLAQIIAIGPLLIDMAVYVLVCYGIITLLPQLAPTGVKGKVIAAVLWLAACVSLLLVALALTMDPSFVAWQLDSYFGSNATRHYSLQLGIGS